MCKYSIEKKEIYKYIVSLSTCAHKAFEKNEFAYCHWISTEENSVGKKI